MKDIKLLTYKQVADVLSISLRTLYRYLPTWVAEGKLKIILVGGSRRVSVDDLESLLESLKVEAVEV